MTMKTAMLAIAAMTLGPAVSCWMSVCCEFGYSLCDGVYTPQGARELGANMLKAAVRPLTSLGTSGRPIATEFKASGGRTA